MNLLRKIAVAAGLLGATLTAGAVGVSMLHEWTAPAVVASPAVVTVGPDPAQAR